MPREREDDHGADGLARARYCADCASWRVVTPCPVCGADLVAEDEGEDAPVAGAARGPSRGEFTLRLLREVAPSLPGALVCALLSGGVLASQTLLPFGDLDWPPRIVAGFVACAWLLERARAARTQGADLDMIALGGVLLRALYLLPALVGILTLHPAAVPVAVVFALLGPLLLAALAGEEPLTDLAPRALAQALLATDGYARYAALSSVGLAAVLVALGWDEGDPLWRGPAIGLGAALAGTAAGLSRRSAERTPE
ncbi:MAG: hypothetical protein M9894_33550 [Planctomycetes bacterium]|nr:hypothetical protein [Planctomycetota bacterium]